LSTRRASTIPPPRNWRSVGLATDLQIAALRGPVTDRGDYVVVRTPDDPGYYFGNQLVLPAPPQVGEVAYWQRKFAAEFGDDPAIRHVALRWDGITGDTGARVELEAAGFTLEIEDVLIAPAVRPAPAPIGVTIRPLYARELATTAQLAFAISDDHSDGYRTFLARRAAWQQLLVSKGAAMWWGAFAGPNLVGSLGLIALSMYARFQDVQTATDQRKRGIASALLAAAAHSLLDPRELVIVSVEGSAASRVYERAGFSARERVVVAQRVPEL
jgi:ribosomal protein S18 acetylase RimI-like enzyme